MKIRITQTEFDLIREVLNKDYSYFNSEKINEYEVILSFDDIDKALKFDELIKDKLVYQGFDINYDPNQFGRMCESVIDKMHEILK